MRLTARRRCAGRLAATLLAAALAVPAGAGGPPTHQEDASMTDIRPVHAPSGGDAGGGPPRDRSEAEAVHVRLRNASPLDFDATRVFFPDAPDRAVDFGPLPAGAASDYRPAAVAYRYAHVEITAGERSFVLRPFDYVGETPLAPGRVTYVLGVEGDRLTVEARRD